MSHCPQKCSADLCRNDAKRGGLCWAHDWRRKHGSADSGEVRPWGRAPEDLLVDAALDMVEAGDFDREALEAGWHRLRMAARRYAASEAPRQRGGWRQWELWLQSDTPKVALIDAALAFDDLDMDDTPGWDAARKALCAAARAYFRAGRREKLAAGWRTQSLRRASPGRPPSR
jgi:hypothetical protein